MVPPATMTDIAAEQPPVRLFDDDRESMRLLIELLAEA
jgi:hypothetical protein